MHISITFVGVIGGTKEPSRGVMEIIRLAPNPVFN